MGRRGNSCSVLFGAWALSGRVRACANLFFYSRVHVSFSSQWDSFVREESECVYIHTNIHTRVSFVISFGCVFSY